MAPNIDTFKSPSPPGPTLYLSPLHQNQEETASSDDIDSEEEFHSDSVLVPIEQNLRGLLVKLTGTENLETVTQVKLRVIAHDLPLQHLVVHIPALRELVLDGSIVSTLRDLGSGLRNLRILRVNRCGLVCIDGVFGFESLEELYAADNLITNPMPCTFLTDIKVIDLRRNCLKDVVRTLPFLTLCEKLKHIYLEGNDEISNFRKYRQIVKSLLPALKSLDGITFSLEESNRKVLAEDYNELQQDLDRLQSKATVEQAEKSVFCNFNPLRARPFIAREASTGFTVTFPPKLLTDRKLN